MKKALLYYTVILLIGFDVNCQTGIWGVSDTTTIAGSGERIRLYTDRNLYCVNENIFFTADYTCNSKMDSIMWSKVLYVELINWNGGKLANLKLKLDKSGTSGSLRIPGDLLSGNYYLRAYTKWMRNFSASNYEYRLIKIVNPFKEEIEAGPSEFPDPRRSILNMKSSGELLQGVGCSMNKSQYHSREKAEVELYIPDKSVGCHDFCVSIAKAGSIDTSYLLFEPELEPSGIKWGDIEYLPELMGITISGKIIDKTMNTSKKNLLVSLSESAHGTYFSVYETRDKGRFIFSLPDLYGKYDFFIQTEASDTGPSEFLIDNGFCNRPVLLPYIAFNLNQEETQLIRDMMVNMQLNERFRAHPDTAKNLQTNRDQVIPFYGSRKHNYYTRKYIELPNIKEFFSEIVLEAEVVYDKGGSKLKISGYSGFSNYPPLIFLDNVQVNNDDRLLTLPLDRIESVETIENAYMVGNTRYSGLISIYSKNKDFAGIEMNKNSMFFAFDLFSDHNADFTFDENSYDSRIPDRRNLLYWNPNMQLSAGQKNTLSFYTPDNKGDFVVYVIGKNERNERAVYGTCSFTVK